MQTSRRDFIRVLGTGVTIGAAGTMLGGCWDMPDRAVEGWAGPAANLEDIRVRALAFAILAPNPHNKQAWSVDISRDGEILLHVDRSRLLPETDPFSRQIMIGQGTFLELLALATAAQGHRAAITLFPEGAFGAEAIDARPVARVQITRDDSVRRDPLFDQVLKRRTNREAFADRPLSAEHAAEMTAAFTGRRVRLTLGRDTEQVADLRRIVEEAWDIEIMTPRTLKESIDVTRIGATEIGRHRDGISVTGFMPWFGKTVGMITPASMQEHGSMGFRIALEMGRTQARSAAAFAWLTTVGNDRVAQVETGRAYARLHLQATALGIAFHPMSQALQEYPEVQTTQRKLREALPVSPSETVQMLVRLGYAEAPGPSPRRPLQTFLRV